MRIIYAPEVLFEGQRAGRVRFYPAGFGIKLKLSHGALRVHSV